MSAPPHKAATQTENNGLVGSISFITTPKNQLSTANQPIPVVTVINANPNILPAILPNGKRHPTYVERPEYAPITPVNAPITESIMFPAMMAMSAFVKLKPPPSTPPANRTAIAPNAALKVKNRLYSPYLSLLGTSSNE